MRGNFDICLPKLLVHEGGNDDDPQDPGGRTSRGITQSEYTEWRKQRGQSWRDVWQADDAEVEQIYYANYWVENDCDNLPAGVDYSVFDYGVNSGIRWAAKELQAVIGATEDGVIGPKTCFAASFDPQKAIKALAAERLHFLRGLKTWDRFKGGWGTRVADVLHDSLQMTAA